MESGNERSGVKCTTHPDAPHSFMRDASHSAGRYVCECESWEPPKNNPMTRGEWTAWLEESWAEAQKIAASRGEELHPMPVQAFTSAVAPDLLEALKMAVIALERSDYIRQDGDSHDVVDVSRAVIAKATGGDV